MQIYRDMLEPFTNQLLLLCLLLLVALIFLLLKERRNKRRVTLQLEHANRLLQHIQPSAGLENNLHFLLEVFASVVEAPGYAFYLLDSKQQRYLLKAVRNQTGELGPIAPSYSGLTPYKKEQYHPPISVAFSLETTRMELITEGEVPLLNIPMRGGKGIIRIGPIDKVPKSSRMMLDYLTEKLPQILEMLTETEQLKMQAEVAITSEKALRTVGSMALDPIAVLHKTLGMSAMALGVSGSFVLIRKGDRYECPVLFGWTREEERRIASEAEMGALLAELTSGRGVIAIRKDEEAFRKLPQVFHDSSAEMLIVSRCFEHAAGGFLVCKLDGSQGTSLSIEHLAASVRTLSSQMSQLVSFQERIQPLTASYVEVVKALCRTIDNLNPYTVGYSEMMSRFSIVIAREMGLPPKQIQDIALAAYVSNIGVIGLSEELYLKEGKYTEAEYETMKLHAEVGAMIMEMTTGNKTVASYIRHHHERMDGNGYPDGLRGEEIPVGARILAVVQTFLAKINGRKYRQPLSFERALAHLQVAAGTQLDPLAVDTFIQWFQTKRGSSEFGKALGPCWEMCCSPKEICVTCPAFQNVEKNCWEMERNNCQSHGKSCESCFVYTEAMARSAVHVYQS